MSRKESAYTMTIIQIYYLYIISHLVKLQVSAVNNSSPLKAAGSIPTALYCFLSVSAFQ